VQILALSGSLRRGSMNSALLRAARELAPEGVEVLIYERLESVEPYNGDRDHPGQVPPGAQSLRDALAAADGLLIASPEYNGSMPGQIKNAIDWLSRPFKESSIFGKPVVTMSAVTGAFGGVWGQADLRKSLGIAGARVIEGELAVAKAQERISEEGHVDEALRHDIELQLQRLIEAIEPSGAPEGLEPDVAVASS
jgi:chromate reductase